MEQTFTFLFLIILFSSIMTIISINPIHSIFWMVMIFINSAGVLLTVGLEFMSFIIIIIYVGAITILFLFVIMMLDIIHFKTPDKLLNFNPIILISCSILTLQLWFLINNKSSKLIKDYATNLWEFELSNHISTLGVIIYNSYASLIIIVSLVLLVGLIGAILLTLDLNTITKRQYITKQIQRSL